MKADVYNKENKKVDVIELPGRMFEAKWNPDLVHQAVVSLQSNKRKPWAHTKDRSEVRGGGKKPWRQKGTGRARAGSIRSPLWRGGGVTFGPRKERSYEKKINKKMKRAALFSLLSKKLKEGEIKIIDAFGVEVPKTKQVVQFLKNVVGNKDGQDRKMAGVLLVAMRGNKAILLAARNIPKNKVTYPDSVNIYDCLSHRHILFERDAILQTIAHHNNQ